ncbi:Flp pilus assembly protein CpaB [Prosthecodimorpha staleyi]|uniref:Flp pilus assembly protein CpaB n=1 Tax=Prosthecodimorpha staleyi TaxID=2840188 RepID=A0A947D8F9_9HYPH|nr:Flp pilus assembly protein CpaB [Prosthecodimorpha staleyi]MBT9292313.1 Flp pilus assembly protein CpaB [Prosthecodimorpha staleyi]
MRTNTVVMLLLALVFGGAAVFMSQSYLERQAEKRARTIEVSGPAVAASTVVVAAKPLNFGAEIARDALKEVAWPAEAVPAGAFRTVAELFAQQGRRVALVAIEANEPILPAKISGPGQRATLSSVIEEGMKAVTVKVDEVNGVAGFVLPGDRVDVLLTRHQGEGDAITEVLVERARVLAVDQSFDQRAEKPAVPKAVTLEVHSGVAQKVAFASSVGTISLVLRRAGEALADNQKNTRVRAATVSVSRATKRQEYGVRSEVE